MHNRRPHFNTDRTKRIQQPPTTRSSGAVFVSGRDEPTPVTVERWRTQVDCEFPSESRRPEPCSATELTAGTTSVSFMRLWTGTDALLVARALRTDNAECRESTQAQFFSRMLIMTPSFEPDVTVTCRTPTAKGGVNRGLRAALEGRSFCACSQNVPWHS